MKKFLSGKLVLALLLSCIGLTMYGQNIALNKPATTSGSETTALGPANAFDGNATTRWGKQNALDSS